NHEALLARVRAREEWQDASPVAPPASQKWNRGAGELFAHCIRSDRPGMFQQLPVSLSLLVPGELRGWPEDRLPEGKRRCGSDTSVLLPVWSEATSERGERSLELSQHPLRHPE